MFGFELSQVCKSILTALGRQSKYKGSSAVICGSLSVYPQHSTGNLKPIWVA